MRRKIAIIVLLLFLVMGLVTFLIPYNQEGFTGNRVKSSDFYILDIARMNGTDLHTLELDAGDTLRIRFETEKGSLYMEIKAPDGTLLYAGNGKETTNFTVSIPESGLYTVAVEARNAKGTIYILVAD